MFVGIWGSPVVVMARDVERAKALFDGGMRDMPEGNYERACPAFAESLRLDPLPGTAFTLAVCESRSGHVATAQARYKEFLRMVDALGSKEKKKQEERCKVAEEQIEKLSPLVPTLRLLLDKEAPRGTVVKRNEVVVGEAELGVAVRVDPGEYWVATEAPGLTSWKKKIIVGKGDRIDVSLSAPGTASDRGAESFTRAPWPSRKMAGVVVGGVGIAGLVVGTVTTGLAFGQKGVLDEHCGAKIGETNPLFCDITGKEAAQSIGNLNLISTIAFAAGGLGVGIGIALFLTAPSSTSKSSETSNNTLHVGLLSAGPSGVMAGVRGGF